MPSYYPGHSGNFLSSRQALSLGRSSSRRLWRQRALLLLVISSSAPVHAQSGLVPQSAIAVDFEGKYGQLEIGGKYVGAEFHHSFPLPARISFYSPVANSIDHSDDYWRRDESRPFSVVIAMDGKSDTVGREPFGYRWTPFGALFTQTKPSYEIEISYRFCEDLPVMVFELKLRNLSKEKKEFHVATALATSLRTCQSYIRKDNARLTYIDSHAIALTDFDEVDTDSTQIFVANAGERPRARSTIRSEAEGTAQPARPVPVVSFAYERALAPNQQLAIVQLIGSCRRQESTNVLERSLRDWQQSVAAYEKRIEAYATRPAAYVIPDTALAQTMRWAKAVLAANRHFLDGRIVPMPCPAEYNFFFTHDVLVTDLGAVFFDLQRVQNDLLFLHTLAQADSVLPHAYYWRDDGFKTEFCAPDNWNHLWFIILAGSYLKHSGDRQTLSTIYPMLQKSLALMLRHRGAGDLMYASRPDWWDIGKVYGARAYITTLMIRALRAFSFVALQLGEPQEKLGEYLHWALRMQEGLGLRLWKEDAGYLMNMLDATTWDNHFYAGSLLAAAFDLLDEEKKSQLLETAGRELLDDKIGIRNAMPADFHQLIEVYGFNGMEAGEPFLYMNGGVWSQGIAWYALGLLTAGKPDAAEEAIKKYLTLAGIRHSPNGQPALFEYRNANPVSPQYGQIDKPTFLWAAGWFLYALYHLNGVRENEWNISFDANLPRAFEHTAYELTLNGKRCQVSWHGAGKYFKQIAADDRVLNSAVVFSSPQRISLERGVPVHPYLAYASATVTSVHYDRVRHNLAVEIQGIRGQSTHLKVVSPSAPRKLLLDGEDRAGLLSMFHDSEVVVASCQFSLRQSNTTVEFGF